MSPLWVQAPEDHYAVTGGGVEELLNATGVKMSHLDRATAHVTSVSVKKALGRASDGADAAEWTEDPSQVHDGPNKGDRLVGGTQREVAEITQRERDDAEG